MTDPIKNQIENVDQEAFWKTYKRDFSALETHPGVILELSAAQAWCVASAIQLACRHPLYDGPSSGIVKDVAQQILTAVATTPALKLVAERGWNPAYDIEATGREEDDGA